MEAREIVVGFDTGIRIILLGFGSIAALGAFL